MCGLPLTPNEKELVFVATISGKAVLITGGNRGIGRALAVEALNRGARRVYVGTRKALADNGDSRVTPLTLDITDDAHRRAAAEQVDALDILVNNAGLALYDDLSDPSALQRHLDVNLFGTYAVIQTFLPLLVRSAGSIVNNLSVNALAPLPIIPAYSVSKAAAFSMTQSLRVILAPQGVRVHAVLTGPVDTEMTRELDIPKSSPQSVAHAIFDGGENGDDEIFPDQLSGSLAAGWERGAAKVLERQYAGLLGADH
ncbi:SDR family NAD(P)-dependent oxidoreductase [Mycobacterium sp. E3247]|uniref:SDR family NAD(P)-dependent oxidoreductase n=1 Tax=Mycobacterium sp. E3247 TaxID=1856864 RepID=UPI000800E5B8|nr:short-chain dehydrogenase [Mycobacterium sp. E3247]